MTSTNLLTFLEKERSEAKDPRKMPLWLVCTKLQQPTHTPYPPFLLTSSAIFAKKNTNVFIPEMLRNKNWEKTHFVTGIADWKRGGNPQLTRETTEEHYYYTQRIHTYLHFPPTRYSPFFSRTYNYSSRKEKNTTHSERKTKKTKRKWYDWKQSRKMSSPEKKS